MILGLDISTSITGATILDKDGNIIYNEAWGLKKHKDIFEKAYQVRQKLLDICGKFHIKEIHIEKTLQTFRSGYSSAKTLSILSSFNGMVSWLCYDIFVLKPEYIAASSARKLCGIRVPRGQKAKSVVIQYILDNVPSVTIEYTKHGNVKAECYDKADSYIIAQSGYIKCQREKNDKS